MADAIKQFFFVLLILLSHASMASAGENQSRAEEILMWMEGEWSFTLGERSGGRTVRMVYPHHLVSYNENFDGTDIRGEGYIGYSPENNLFYSFAAHSEPGAVAFLRGAIKANDDVIMFTPEDGSDEEPYEVVWQRRSKHVFTSTLFTINPSGQREVRWTATFTRKDTL